MGNKLIPSHQQWCAGNCYNSPGRRFDALDQRPTFQGESLMLFNRSLFLLLVTLSVVAVVMTITGCGGGSDTNVPVGGSISGVLIDALDSSTLGGVTVAVTHGSVTYEATSSYPGGIFTIQGLPDGSYSTITVTPPDDLYGGARNVLLTTPLVISGGNAITLDAPILVVDSTPPDVPSSL